MDDKRRFVEDGEGLIIERKKPKDEEKEKKEDSKKLKQDPGQSKTNR